ncbi:MAG: class I SAM-dependent methyltransferase [Myxococcota bacterium]
MTPNESIAVELGAVQETLLIPLLGRARETAKKERGVLADPRAVEIVESLDYDFSKWEDIPSLLGCCIRTKMYDRYVEDFLAKHPEGTVIELGSGLNTRFERMDNGTVHWFDLDLPDVITLRRKFFQDTSRRTMVSASVLDDAWVDQVKASPGPYLFLSEAVLIYLEEEKVKQAIGLIARNFPGATLVLDTTGAINVEGQKNHDAMRHLSPDSWFRWKCDDPKQLEDWDLGLELVSSKTFLDADDSIIAKLPFMWRTLVKFTPWLLRIRMGKYRLNAFSVTQSAGDDFATVKD